MAGPNSPRGKLCWMTMRINSRNNKDLIVLQQEVTKWERTDWPKNQNSNQTNQAAMLCLQSEIQSEKLKKLITPSQIIFSTLRMAMTPSIHITKKGQTNKTKNKNPTPHTLGLMKQKTRTLNACSNSVRTGALSITDGADITIMAVCSTPCCIWCWTHNSGTKIYELGPLSSSVVRHKELKAGVVGHTVVLTGARLAMREKTKKPTSQGSEQELWRAGWQAPLVQPGSGAG